MAVFYQTYRPQNFGDVVGQEAIVKALSQAVKLGKIGHAYLFTGSRGVGKTTLARILAKAANCTNLKDGDPCGKCETCLAISRGNFLDCVEIDAASHTGVDNIRELIDRIQFAPASGAKKVFIIDEVHMLSKAAFNALLKTLEEPPAHALFILATTDIEKVPDTIVSRTQRFDFRKITKQQLLSALQAISKKEKLVLPEGALDVIVENSEGGLRDALSQLSMIAVMDKEHTMEDIHLLLGTTPQARVVELLLIIARGDAESVPAFYQQQTELNFDASAFNRKVLTALQQVLETKLGSSMHEIEESLLGAYSLQQILYIIRLFLRAYKEIDKALSPELPLLLASIEAALYMAGSGTGQEVSQRGSEPSTPVPTPKTKPSAIDLAEKPRLEPKMEAVVATVADSNLDLTADIVTAWWPELVEVIKKINSPVATLLKNCPLYEVGGSKVSVAVKFLFHKEQLENSKNRLAISEFLSQKAGGPVEFRAIIAKDTVGEKIADTAQAVGDALKIFGGELVE